jgi:hypothetical protein
MRKFLKWLDKKLHCHDWECVGRYKEGFDNHGYVRMTFQYRCRTCGEWKEITE